MLSKVLIFLLFGFVLANLKNEIPQQFAQYINFGEDQHINLYYLGSVGGKGFFADQTERNWTSAKSYCEGMNMKLASITRIQEQNFLDGAYQPGVFDYWYWTAARDSHTQNQFVWDTNKRQVNLSLDWTYHLSMNRTNFLTCGAYSISSTSSLMLITDCARNDGYVLCEAQNAKQLKNIN